MWVLNRDNNSSFIHNSIRFHNHYNTISHISDFDGNISTQWEGIEQIFVNFFLDYGRILQEKNFVLFHALLNDLFLVSDIDCEIITGEVTKDEVYQALLSLPSSKSPDGFNTEFNHFSGMLLPTTYLQLFNISFLILLCQILGVKLSSL